LLPPKTSANMRKTARKDRCARGGADDGDARALAEATGGEAEAQIDDFLRMQQRRGHHAAQHRQQQRQQLAFDHRPSAA